MDMDNHEEFMGEIKVLAADYTQAGADRKKITQAVAKVYRRMDDAMAAVNVQTACQKGCNYCCHYHVYISAPEAFTLAETINAMLPEQKATVMGRLKANLDEIRRMSLQEHMNTNISCALLADADGCMVYSSRPSACRNHHSMEVEPCKVTFDDTASGMQSPRSADLTEAAYPFMSLIVMAQEFAGLDRNRYEFNGAVMEALTNPASARRWADGKVAFPTVKDRTLT